MDASIGQRISGITIPSGTILFYFSREIFLVIEPRHSIQWALETMSRIIPSRCNQSTNLIDHRVSIPRNEISVVCL